MVTAVTADPDVYYHSFPIEKMETDPVTGTLYVYGKATTPEIDSDEQIVDSDWSAKAMTAWFQTGPNVRVQHNASLMPAGSGVKVEIDRDGDQAHWVKAAIDEPTAKMMCEKGHLRAFSVGIAKPLIVRDVTGKARGGIIKGGELAEISLVDRPANRSCYVELAKAAGADGHVEFTGKVGGADLLAKNDGTLPDVVQLDLPADVSLSFTPGDLAKLLEARRVAEDTMMGKDWTTWDEAHQGEQRQAAGQKPDAHQLHVMHEVHEQHAAHEHAEHEAHDAHTAHEEHVEREAAEAAASARSRATTHTSSKPAAKPEPHQTTAGNLAHANAITAETAGKTAEVDRDDAVDPGEPEPRKPATRAEPMDDDPQETDPAAHGKLDEAQRSGPGAKSTSTQTRKRDMDPDVGGGTDRDKIPDADFAGRNRSYPIVTPGDVPDAATSIGRAGPGNYGPDQLRANITSIAHRKGPQFAAQLPDSWRNGDRAGKAASVDTSEDLTTKGGDCPLCKGRGKIRDGHVKCPRCKGSGKFGGAEADADMTKAGKRSCKECGQNHHSDFPGKFCEGCGAKLPPAGKSAEAGDTGDGAEGDLLKAGKDDGGKDSHLAEADEASDDDPDDGEDDGDDTDDSPEDDDDEDTQADSDSAGKASRPTPSDGVPGKHSDPVPAHREPDGQAIEDMEHTAHLPTDPDGRYEKSARLRFKTLGVPPDLGRLHDLTCAAFHPDDVAKCHPGATLTGVLDPGEWAAKAFEAATSAPLGEAGRAQLMWQNTVTLKGADPADVAEVADAVHKAFEDANPGPGHGMGPTPAEITPTSYKRPYITAGHAAASPGQEGPNTARVPAGQTTAADYHRGYITDGHAEQSPANKGEGRLFYRNTARDSVQQAMAAIHDHIAQTFPNLCPMSGSGANPLPTPAGKSAAAETGPAPMVDADGLAYDEAGTRQWLATQVIKGEMTADEALEALGMPPLVTPNGHTGWTSATGANWTGKAAGPGGGAYAPDLIKAAVAEAVGPLADQLGAQALLIKRQGRMLAKQAEVLDALADAPDVNVAPYRGPAFPNPASLSPVGAVEQPRTVTKAAEQSQMNVARNLADEWRNNPDPAVRERAWQALSSTLGIGGK